MREMSIDDWRFSNDEDEPPDIPDSSIQKDIETMSPFYPTSPQFKILIDDGRCNNEEN